MWDVVVVSLTYVSKGRGAPSVCTVVWKDPGARHSLPRIAHELLDGS